MDTSSPLPSVILENLTSAVPTWLIILLVVLLILGVIFRPRPPRRRSMVSPKLQLEAVRRVEFERCPLLNRSESAVFVVLEEVLRDLGGYRLMAQTSLGEVIRPVPRSGTKIALEEARASINSKRLDFAVFDTSGALVLALEYHGHGHHNRTSALRDAVKREALSRAGVPLIEIPERWNAGRLAGDVRAALVAEAPQVTPPPESQPTAPTE